MKPPRISPIKSPAATLPNDSDGSVQKKKRERTSKLKRLGDVLRQGLLESNSLRREHRLSNKANAAILSVLPVASEGDVAKNKSVLRRLENYPQEMSWPWKMKLDTIQKKKD